MSSLILRHARVLPVTEPVGVPLAVLPDHAIWLQDGVITWCGPDDALPAFATGPELDAAGALVTPGLIDCHTHAIFDGDRAHEFGLRAAGRSYLEIAAAGGGIVASTGPTRAASDERLTELLIARLDRMLAMGATTVEVKTGYDLTALGELRLLRCIQAAACAGGRAQTVIATLLAHVIPTEAKADRAGYLRAICDTLIPAAATTLATSVDVYCDDGAYTLDEARAIWQAARHAGLDVRGHVGQFSDQGAAGALAALGALSADHLEYIDATQIAALAAAGTVAVMLPTACVQLRLPVPPIAQLRAAGVPLALATDLNPGSSYVHGLALPMWLATTHFAMTIDEAWRGVTVHAARALGLTDRGRLAPGLRADLVIWDADDPAAIPYRPDAATPTAVVAGGVVSCRR